MCIVEHRGRNDAAADAFGPVACLFVSPRHAALHCLGHLGPPLVDLREQLLRFVVAAGHTRGGWLYLLLYQWDAASDLISTSFKAFDYFSGTGEARVKRERLPVQTPTLPCPVCGIHIVL